MMQRYLVVWTIWITSLYAFWNVESSTLQRGGPKEPVTLDRYNTQWRWDQEHYGRTEPQQIHLSWGSNGKHCRVQFSTLKPIKSGLLKYWDSRFDERKATMVDQSEEDWAFVDGEVERRTQYMHTMRFGKLTDASRYRYRVGARVHEQDVWSAIYEFQTPDPRNETFGFLVTGDFGAANAVSMPFLRELVVERQHDFLAVVGDQGYDLADFDGRKGDDFLNFAQPVYANIPTLTVVGNHEATRNFTQYKHRFRLMPFRESGFADATQYSFDYKSVHFVAFSTEVYFNGTDAQMRTSLQWLEQDLKRTEQPWIIVLGHRPMYCASQDLVDCLDDAERLRYGRFDASGTRWGGLERVFVKYKVDLYLCGHRHDYERTYPVANNQVSSYSYVNPSSYFQVISGNSGNFEGPDQLNPRKSLPEWIANQYSGYGLSSIVVSPGRLELFHWETKLDSSRGRLVDHISVNKTVQRSGRANFNALI